MECPLRPLAELTRRGQIGRLRKLAKKGLEQWDLQVDSMHSLDHGENTTFAVNAHFHGQKGRFVVRIHRPGYQSRNTILSEMAWLDALTEAGFHVPQPVTATNGDRVLSLSVAGVPEPRFMVVFHWIPGRFVRGQGAHKLGQLTATLHQHARNWQPPAQFQRHRWDANGLIGPDAIWGSLNAVPVLSAKDRKLLETARQQAHATIESAGTSQDKFGLIHADLHPRNVLIRARQACPIDFDDTGWGYWAYDIAVATYRFEPNQRQAFLKGYRTVLPLQTQNLTLIPPLMIARGIMSIGWLWNRRDVAGIANRIPRALESVLPMAKAWLSGVAIAKGLCPTTEPEA